MYNTKRKTQNASVHTPYTHTRVTHTTLHRSTSTTSAQSLRREDLARDKGFRVCAVTRAHRRPIATSRRRRHRHHPPPIAARARAHKNIPPTRIGARRATACFPPKTARAFARTDGAIVIDHALMGGVFRLTTAHVDERRNNGYIVMRYTLDASIDACSCALAVARACDDVGAPRWHPRVPWGCVRGHLQWRCRSVGHAECPNIEGRALCRRASLVRRPSSPTRRRVGRRRRCVRRVPCVRWTHARLV